jgi:hypothetical protein
MDKLIRCMALDRLERHGKFTEVGGWIRLEPETIAILGSGRVLTEAQLKAAGPEVIMAIVGSRACFAPGALLEARSAGITPSMAVDLAAEHAAEFVQAHGSAMALVGGVTAADLKGWAGK